IDPLATVVLEKAEHIVIVTQQSLAHIRDAKRLLKVLTSTLAVPSEYITVVVNRYMERSPISLRDISDAISPPHLAILPNDFQSVSQALDVGSPLFELNRDLPITRALCDLLDTLLSDGAATPPSPQEPRPKGLRAVLAHALRS
ncbi:MAG: AAA family ATPase, partial [Vicinamibacterales bacterium]